MGTTASGELGVRTKQGLPLLLDRHVAGSQDEIRRFIKGLEEGFLANFASVATAHVTACLPWRSTGRRASWPAATELTEDVYPCDTAALRNDHFCPDLFVPPTLLLRPFELRLPMRPSQVPKNPPWISRVAHRLHARNRRVASHASKTALPSE